MRTAQPRCWYCYDDTHDPYRREVRALPIDILWFLGIGIFLILPALLTAKTKEKRLRLLKVDLVMLFGLYIVAYQLPKVFSLEENAVGRVLLLILFGVVFKLIMVKLGKRKTSSSLK